MKKTYLLLMLGLVTGYASIGQSHLNNIDVALNLNGVNGSNSGTGAYIAVSIRIKPGGLSYMPTPVAEDYVLYLMAPKTDFSVSDVVQIMEVNSAMYGGTATTLMLEQGVYDIGPNDVNNLYFPVVLNSGSGVNLSSLSSVTNAWSFSFTFRFNNAKTAAAFNKIKLVDQTNNGPLSAFAGGTVFTNIPIGSANQLTAGAFSTLPVSLLNFSGYKNGIKNTLRWTSSGEQNNLGFEVQRSADGVNYSAISFVNSLANGGNSSTELSYTFEDNSPAISKKQYYRLNQKDIDGRSKLSNIVLIRGDKSNTFSIEGLFPNPARELVNVLINAPQRDDVTLIVTDVLGRTVKQKVINVEIGSNTVPVDIANLASGSYVIKALCKSSDCDAAVGKFNKQ